MFYIVFQLLLKWFLIATQLFFNYKSLKNANKNGKIKAVILAIGIEASKLLKAVKKTLPVFKSLFKGREDIYATRWEKGNKNGYSPVYTDRKGFIIWKDLLEERIV